MTSALGHSKAMLRVQQSGFLKHCLSQPMPPSPSFRTSYHHRRHLGRYCCVNSRSYWGARRSLSQRYKRELDTMLAKSCNMT